MESVENTGELVDITERRVYFRKLIKVFLKVKNCWLHITVSPVYTKIFRRWIKLSSSHILIFFHIDLICPVSFSLAIIPFFPFLLWSWGLSPRVGNDKLVLTLLSSILSSLVCVCSMLTREGQRPAHGDFLYCSTWKVFAFCPETRAWFVFIFWFFCLFDFVLFFFFFFFLLDWLDSILIPLSQPPSTRVTDLSPSCLACYVGAGTRNSDVVLTQQALYWNISQPRPISFKITFKIRTRLRKDCALKRKTPNN